MTDKYAVVGNPIAHSKSPLIHGEFAKDTEQDMVYTAQLVGLNNFANDVTQFFNAGGAGLNVTVPFKEDAYLFADVHTERAKRADNTDGVGLVRDITCNYEFSITEKRILILGAGGAVRGVLQPILEAQPFEVVIANRTLEKAELLADNFSDLGNIHAQSFETLQGPFDLIINGTSASLSGDLPPIPSSVINTKTVCYDMMYSKEQTVFNAWANAKGASQTIDGLGMLIEQAAEAFFLWRKIRPDTKKLTEFIRHN